MSDLSQGQGASLVLGPNDAYTISTVGVATVKSIYGAPSGTTTLTAQSKTFGPYGANAKLDLLAVGGSATYSIQQSEYARIDPVTGGLLGQGGKPIATPPMARPGSVGLPLWDMSTLTGYSVDSGATLALVDTPAVSARLGKSVAKSIQVTVPQGVQCQFFFPDLPAALQNPGGSVCWVVELVSGTLGANNSILNLYLATDNSYANFYLWNDQTLRHGVVTTAATSAPVGSGAPDLSSIKSGKFRIQADTAPVTIIIHGVFVAQSSVPTVSITHDDGWLDAYTELAPLLNKYGFKAGFGIIADLIGSNAALYMNKGQLDKLYADGHDVMTHGANALNSYPTAAAALADIDYNRNWLIQQGYSRGLTGYVYPNGFSEFSATDLWSIRQHLKDIGVTFGFMASGDFWHPAGGVNSLNLYRSAMDANAVAATFLTNLDAAVATGRNATLMVHKVKASGASGGTEVNRAVLAAVLDGLWTRQKAGALRVVSPSEQMSICGITAASF